MSAAAVDFPTIEVGKSETTLQSRSWKPNEFTCNRCGVVLVKIVREFETSHVYAGRTSTTKKLELDTRGPKCHRVIWEVLAIPCSETPIRSEFWAALKAANKFNGVKTEKIVTCLPLPKAQPGAPKPRNPIVTSRRVCPYKDVAHLITFKRTKWPEGVTHLTEDIETVPFTFERETEMPKIPQIPPLAGMTPLFVKPLPSEVMSVKQRNHAVAEAGSDSEAILALREELQQLKDTILAMGVLRDVQKISIPATQHAPGSASTSKRDWSKVTNEKLLELHGRYLVGSPKWKASHAELTARGIHG